MNSCVHSMKQVVVQNQYNFAAGFQKRIGMNERQNIIFINKEYDNEKEYDETDDNIHL